MISVLSRLRTGSRTKSSKPSQVSKNPLQKNHKKANRLKLSQFIIQRYRDSFPHLLRLIAGRRVEPSNCVEQNDTLILVLD